MKRIKYEDIQASIQNYIKQRNLNLNIMEHSSPANTDTPQDKSKDPLKAKGSVDSNQTLDLNLMALNDLVLIESTINDFYSFSFDSSSDQEYLKQYELIKEFVRKNKSQFEELLFPLFVYMCIDLVMTGYSIKNLINESKNSLENVEQRCLFENLLLFNETKDLSRCKLVSNWKENKYPLKFSSKDWNIFLNLLRQSNVHLFLRIINLNLKIIVNDQFETENDVATPAATTFLFESDEKVKEPINDSEIQSKEINDNKKESTNKINSSNLISLRSLNDCIEKINCQPSRLNGLCCCYVNDTQDCITSVNISPNTEMIAISNENSSIHVYELNENKTIYTNSLKKKAKMIETGLYRELVGGHSSTVFKSKFTHDSKYLVSCGDDNTACLWNLNKTKQIKQNDTDEEEDDDDENNEENFDSKLKSCFGPNSESNASLVTCYSGHLYSIWDLELFSQLNLFVTASKDATARLWSFDRIYPLRVFAGHQSDVNCVKFHPNGAYLATGSSDKTVRLWSVSTGEFVRLFSGHRSRVYSLAFSPDGTYLASAGEDKKIKIYDLRSGLVYKEFKGHADTVHSLSFDNNSEILCSGGMDKTVKFWDFHQKNIQIGPKVFSFDSTPQNTNKNQSSPNTSSELIRSMNVDFSIYSIYCDVQNVFYVNGAKKTNITSTTTNMPAEATNSNSCSTTNQVLIESTISKDKKTIKTEKSIPTDSNTQKPKRISKTKTFPDEKQTSNTQLVENKSTINTRSRRNLSESHSSASAPSAVNLFNNNDDLYEV